MLHDRGSRVAGRRIVVCSKMLHTNRGALRDHRSLGVDWCGGDHADAMTHIPGGPQRGGSCRGPRSPGDARRAGGRARALRLIAPSSGPARRACGLAPTRNCEWRRPRRGGSTDRAVSSPRASKRRCRDCQFFARREALQVSAKIASELPEADRRAASMWVLVERGGLRKLPCARLGGGSCNASDARRRCALTAHVLAEQTDEISLKSGLQVTTIFGTR
jgi:hypothetical protein